MLLSVHGEVEETMRGERGRKERQGERRDSVNVVTQRIRGVGEKKDQGFVQPSELVTRILKWVPYG